MRLTESKLAVVIPAYKIQFIGDTLKSLSLQTDKRFNVYVGNDSGDSNIENLIKEYKSDIKVEYEYFTKNLGSNSLVEAWDRCVKMTNGEPWIWVLPDDDFIDKHCVAGFYRTIELDSSFDLYRFKSAVTDSAGSIKSENYSMPDTESSYLSLIEKIKYNRSSTLAEYIFNRKVYDKYGGFPSLPCAWGSDDAGWYLFGSKTGIKTIGSGKVFLRQSQYNISGDYNRLGTVKLYALTMLFKKLVSYPEFRNDISKYSSDINFEQLSQFFIFNEMRQLKIVLGIQDFIKLGKITSSYWSGGLLKNTYRFWLNYNKQIKDQKI